MVALFGPSEEDRERLRSAVHSLGATSVPGLAAALSWRARKTEKLLALELSRPGTRVTYEPARRLVRWNEPVPAAPPAKEAPVAPPVRELPARAPRSPVPVVSGGIFKVMCPSCHVALIPTGSPSLAVCPQCGRLSSPRANGGESSAASAGPTPAVSSAEATSTKNLNDRRSQELFAAYVTSRPIPCPKCRTPLRHRGLSEYVCPNCAQAVRFPKTSEVVAPGPAPLPPAPPA